MAVQLNNPLAISKFISRGYGTNSSASLLIFIMDMMGIKNNHFFEFVKQVSGDADNIEVMITHWRMDNGITTNSSLLALWGYYPGNASENITSIAKVDVKTGLGFFFNKTAKSFVKRERLNNVPNEFIFFHQSNVAFLSFQFQNKGGGGLSRNFYSTWARGGADALEYLTGTSPYATTRIISENKATMYRNQRKYISFLLKSTSKVIQTSTSPAPPNHFEFFGAETYTFYIKRNFVGGTSHTLTYNKRGMSFHDMIWTFEINLAGLNAISASSLVVESVDIYVTVQGADASVLANRLINQNILIENEDSYVDYTHFIYENNVGGFDTITATGSKTTKITTTQDVIRTNEQYKHQTVSASDKKFNSNFKATDGDFDVFNKNTNITKTAYSGYISTKEMPRWLSLIQSGGVYVQVGTNVIPVAILNKEIVPVNTEEDLFAIKIDYNYLLDTEIPGTMVFN